jgi:Flp pilus assembly protein TadG
MKARLHSDSGQALIWFALSLVVLLGIAALAIDVGRLYGERRRMQNAADAAALAGTHEMCQGRPDADAIAMANDYAIARNGAQWATPEPFGAGTTEKGMGVTVGETVNNVFAIFLNANSTTVSAHAKARCEKTATGCGTWPLALDMGNFQAVGCNEPFKISIDQHALDGGCPEGCDCSHVFTGLDANPQFGWINNCSEIGDPSCNGAVIQVGQCVAGEPGGRVGTQVDDNGRQLFDWYNPPNSNPPVRVALFNSYNSGSCSGYTIVGFGCLVLTPPVYEQEWRIPPLEPGMTCNETIKKVIFATVDCSCTISCGSAGGLPEQTDATIPVLVQ